MLIEIEKKNAMELSENIEKALKYAGKAMQIAEEMCESGEMGMRRGYRNGGNGGGGYNGGGYTGNRTGMRDDEWPEYDDYGYPMGMRRGRNGRYM